MGALIICNRASTYTFIKTLQITLKKSLSRNNSPRKVNKVCIKIGIARRIIILIHLNHFLKSFKYMVEKSWTIKPTEREREREKLLYDVGMMFHDS